MATFPIRFDVASPFHALFLPIDYIARQKIMHPSTSKLAKHFQPDPSVCSTRNSAWVPNRDPSSDSVGTTKIYVREPPLTQKRVLSLLSSDFSHNLYLNPCPKLIEHDATVGSKVRCKTTKAKPKSLASSLKSLLLLESRWWDLNPRPLDYEAGGRWG